MAAADYETVAVDAGLIKFLLNATIIVEEHAPVYHEFELAINEAAATL